MWAVSRINTRLLKRARPTTACNDWNTSGASSSENGIFSIKSFIGSNYTVSLQSKSMPVTQSQPRKWDIKFQESLPTHSATVVSASGDNSAQKRTDNRRPVVTEPLTVGTRGAASCTAPPWAGGSSLTPASALGPLPGRAFPSRGRGEAPAVTSARGWRLRAPAPATRPQCPCQLNRDTRWLPLSVEPGVLPGFGK